MPKKRVTREISDGVKRTTSSKVKKGKRRTKVTVRQVVTDLNNRKTATKGYKTTVNKRTGKVRTKPLKSRNVIRNI